MNSKVKKILKILGIIFLVFVVFVAALILWFKYNMSWKLTEVGRETSPDGHYSLLFHEKGEPDFPFGYSHAKITLYKDEEKINEFYKDVADDGAHFRKDNYSVEWMPVGVVITFYGSEQSDQKMGVLFETGDVFRGYTNEQIEGILKSRYGFDKIEKILKVGKNYRITADGITFFADSDMALNDSYLQEKFKMLTDRAFIDVIGRGLSWKKDKTDNPAEIVYTPKISYNVAGKQDINAFCYDICEWLALCFEELPYEEARTVYTGFIPEIWGVPEEKYWFQDIALKEFTNDDTSVYNALYIYMDNLLGQVSDSGSDDEDLYEEVVQDAVPEADEGTIRLWATYEPESTYVFGDGTEFSMIPVDRAAGSSYYVLMSFKKGRDPDSAELVNINPYNGSGGGAGFLKFINDSDLGFSCLTYSGGSEGMLYRTEDRGQSFKEIELPSPRTELVDGKYYNPFVIAEDAWEEGGKIYLRVGQGLDGDHYNDELGGKTDGLYISEDEGKTFEFEKEILREE